MKEVHKHIVSRLIAVVTMLAGLTFIQVSAQQAAAPQIPGGRADDAARRSEKAAKVLDDIMSAPDKGIPSDLLRRAKAVIVCPEVLKAAFGVGGRSGQCVVSRRTDGGWSTPVFYNMSGASIGPQIGGEKADYVFLIMNDDGMKGLLEDKFVVGGEAGVTAGPVGREVGASTNVTLDAPIFSYSHSKGAFIGAAIKGLALTPDNDLNKAYYGKTAKELVLGAQTMTSTPPAVRALPQALSRHSKA